MTHVKKTAVRSAALRRFAAVLCGALLIGILTGCGLSAADASEPISAAALSEDGEEGQWYYNGEAVCFLRDVLISNGASLTGIRTIPES